MSVISEEKLKEIWSKIGDVASEFKPTTVPESMWGGELALELIQAFPDIVNLLDRSIVKGDPLTEELSEKYQVPMGTDQGDTSLLAQGSRAFSDKFVPEGYESTTERAEAVKGLGAAIYDPLSKFAFKLGGAGQPEVAEEENRPGLRAHQFIGLAAPSAMTGQVARAISGPTARNIRGSTEVTLARKVDNFRRDYGLENKNFLMDTAKRVEENRLSVGPFALTQINDRRDVISKIDLLNTYQRYQGKRRVGQRRMPAWYEGPTAKVWHLLDMTYEALKNYPDAKAVLRGSEELFTPNVMSELRKIASSIPTIYKRQLGGEANKFLDQMAHVLAVQQMYYPFSDRTKWMTETLGKHIFPDNLPLMNTMDFSVNDVQSLMGNYFRGGLTDPKVLNEHVIDFLKLGKDDGLFHISTKPIFNLSNFKTDMHQSSSLAPTSWEYAGVFSWKGKLPLIRDSHKILEDWHNMHPGNRPDFTKAYVTRELVKKDDQYQKAYQANLKNWEDSYGSWWKDEQAFGLPPTGISKKQLEKYQNWKRRKPVFRSYGSDLNLSRNIKVGNGYLSAHQDFLSADTLLATISGRGIWSLKDPKNGALIAADSYQQGSGGVVDRPLSMGTDVNRVFVDATNWDNAYSNKLSTGKMLEMDGKPGTAVLARLTKSGHYGELGELAGVAYRRASDLKKRGIQ